MYLDSTLLPPNQRLLTAVAHKTRAVRRLCWTTEQQPLQTSQEKQKSRKDIRKQTRTEAATEVVRQQLRVEKKKEGGKG